MHDLIYAYRELSWNQTIKWKSCKGKNCNTKADNQSAMIAVDYPIRIAETSMSQRKLLHARVIWSNV